jgi:hypothetical protein
MRTLGAAIYSGDGCGSRGDLISIVAGRPGETERELVPALPIRDERTLRKWEIAMARNGMFRSNKSILILVACICFAIAVLTTAGILSIGSKIDWTDLGLFFGFLALIF